MAQIDNHVLVHSLIFPPDQVSTSYLYGDLVEAFIKSGFKVTVLTTFPHYNYKGDFKGKSKEAGLFWRKTDYFGAEVYHFPQNKSQSSPRRALYILAFHLAFFLKALFVSRIDVILTPSPPLTSGFLSGLLGRIKNAKVIYNVQEIYPDVLIKQGAIRSKFIIDILKWIEKSTYSLSHKVVTIDNLFSRKIQARVSDEKLLIIPNFIDTDLYAPYRGTYDADVLFEGKFVIGYVGNLGKVQDWQAIVKAAHLLEHDFETQFLIIGGGSEYEYLKGQASCLKNLVVLPYQARSRVPMINSRIDVHIIAMTEASDYDGMPSKVYAILSSGRPILASTNEDTPLAVTVKQAQNGIVVPRGSAEGIVNGIESIKQGILGLEANEKGRSYVVNRFSKEVVTQKYVDLIRQLL